VVELIKDKKARKDLKALDQRVKELERENTKLKEVVKDHKHELQEGEMYTRYV